MAAGAAFHRQNLRWLAASAALIVLDQWTKALASTNLPLHEAVAVMPGFNWTLAHNLGVAFSLFNDGAGWQRWGLSGFALAVSAVLLRWLLQLGAHERLSALGLAMVIGGALGIVIDRVRLGYVIDFIELYAGSYYWPAFNVADSSICVGAALLLLAGLRKERTAAT
jgi:signal peptidase II